VAGAFCAKCGSAVAGAAPSGGAAYPPPNPPQGAGYPPQGGYAPQPAAAGMTDNLAGMLCYLAGFITGIIFLVIEPYNKKPNIRFHAFQSIFLNVGIIVFQIVFGIVIGILTHITGMFGLLGLFGLFIPLLWFLLWIYMLISTYQGKTIVLPVIGPLAQKQAGM
jgi:uncharacterized membrane protein